MKALVLVLSLLSTSAFAGDGGFDLWTCVSDSGRTNLTVYVDNFSQAEIPARIVFGIDGQFLTYEQQAEECKGGDDCTQIVFEEGQVTVTSGDFTNLKLSLSDSKATVLKGFVDPRKGYDQSENDISLKCKHHFEGP